MMGPAAFPIMEVKPPRKPRRPANHQALGRSAGIPRNSRHTSNAALTNTMTARKITKT